MINICIIGAGGIGKRWAKAFKLTEGFEVKAVIDAQEERAKEVAQNFNCKFFSDWENLINEKEIQAVVVATPHKFLAPISKGCLKMGKHVLCEKPAGISSEEIRQVISTAKNKGLVYMVGFNHRFHEGFIKARELVEQGKIGDIQFIRARYGFGGRKGYEKEWRHNKEISGGGELLDQGVHMIDMARSFLGDFSKVCGFAQSLYWNTEVDDNAFILLKNNKNQIASIHVSWSNWDPLHNFEIYGKKGYVKVAGLGRKYGGTEKVFLGLLDEYYKTHEHEFVCNPEADNSLVKQLEEFKSAISENREPVPSGIDGLKAVEIVEEIYNKNL